MPAKPESLKLAKELGRQDILLSLARVPNSSQLYVGSSDGKVYSVDPLAEKPEFKALPGEHAGFVTGVALAGDLLVSGAYDGKLIWRKRETGEVVRTVDAHAKWIRKVVASPDGKFIASVGDDMICRVWKADSGERVHELRGHDQRTPNNFPSMLYTCAISADSRLLATADRVGRLCVWDLSGGAKLKELQAPGLYTWDPKQRIHSIGGVRSLAFSPDGKTLLAGGIGHIGNIDHLDGPSRVEAFHWEAGEKVHEFLGDAKGLVEQLAYEPEGRWFVGVGGDNGGLVQFYDLAAKKQLRSDKAPMHIHSAVLSEDGGRLFACGHGKVAVWDIA